MKIALINASPKEENSASAVVLGDLRAYLPQEAQTVEIRIRRPGIDGEMLSLLAGCDAWVFALPLYVDGLPSHLLHALTVLERFFACCPHRRTTVYALVNCGFFEPEQTELAIGMMRFWCSRAKLSWGQGIGFGGGGMLAALGNVPAGKGPKRQAGAALRAMAEHLARAGEEETPPLADRFVKMGIPRVAYQFAAQAGWRKQLRGNGLEREDLFRRK